MFQQLSGAIHSQPTLKGTYEEAFGRSRGGFTCKIYTRADGQCRAFGFVLAVGEVSDWIAVPAPLVISVNRPKLFLSDQGYDGDCVLSSLMTQGILNRSSRQKRIVETRLSATSWLTKTATVSSACSNKLKQFRRVSTRFDRSAASFAAFLALAQQKFGCRILSTEPRLTATVECYQRSTNIPMSSHDVIRSEEGR